MERDLAERIRSIVSDADGTAGEWFDPPAGLWTRIEAAISDEPLTVEYYIDADDVVVMVARDWNSFASDNDAPELAGSVPERTLWSYIGDDSVRELWRLVVERVRTEQTPLTVPLRCDAPSARRWFDMTVTPQDHGVVHFRSTLTFEEPRNSVELLDPNARRDASAVPVAVCSWCAKGHHDEGWLDIEDLLTRLRLLEDALPSVEYGLCPSCQETMTAELLVSTPSDLIPKRSPSPSGTR